MPFEIRTRIVLLTLAALAAPELACAQLAPQSPTLAPDRNVSVRERPHPGYEPVGLRAGAFMLHPQLTTTLTGTDNVYLSDTGRVSDLIATITPELNLTSDWSRHALQVYARAIVRQYAQESSQNTTDYATGFEGRLDVTRDALVRGNFGFARLTEPRTQAGAEQHLFPVTYEVKGGYLEAQQTFDRLRVSAHAEANAYSYDTHSGNPDQSFRDVTIVLGRVRTDYAVSPDTAVFAQIAYNDRSYRYKTSPIVNGIPLFPGLINQDSHGLEALVGVHTDLTHLVRGEVGLGYLQQTYDDPAFSNVAGLGARGKLEWFPTQLVTVTLTGSRTVEDATIVGASGFLSTNVGAQLDYELLRNLILSANYAYGHDDFRGIDRVDTRHSAGLSANYLMTRRVSVGLQYQYFNIDSIGAARTTPAHVNQIGVTLLLRY
jgi:hypothetical protein